MTEWIERAQNGDAEAFIRLMEANRQSLYKIARSFFSEEMDVQDAMSQTVLDCWEKLKTLRRPAYFKTWLIRILVNNCNDILRRRARVTYTDTLPERPADDPDPGDLGFQSLMALLDERTRPVLTLYYGECLKARQIAQILNIPIGTVTARLKRGREKLAALVGQEEKL